MGLSQLVMATTTVWPADESFRYIRDFLACQNGIADFTPSGPNPGPGYEIVDALYVANQNPLLEGDWVVLKSNGEAGTYPHYIHLQFGNSGHYIRPYLHWDAEKQRGFPGTSSTPNINIQHGNYQGNISIHSDLDETHIIIVGESGRRWWNSFGRLKPQNTLYDGTAVQLSEAVTASGSPIPITLPSWPSWAQLGNRVYFWDTETLEIVTINDVDPATRTILISSLGNNKAADAWMAGDVCLFRSTGTDSGSLTALRFVGTPGRASAEGQYAYLRTSGVGRVTDRLYGYDNVREQGTTRFVNPLWFCHTSSGINGVRGFFGLAGETASLPDLSQEAWTARDGQDWRTYRIYSSNHLAFKEKT